jgi:CubicO group peptidase (beta-lactamase class C family)
MTRRQFARILSIAGGSFLYPLNVPLPASEGRTRTDNVALRRGDPIAAGFDPAKLEDVFARIERRVIDGRFPGAVALVARAGLVAGERAFGVRVRGTTEAMTINTLFDLESQTKVLATSPAVMLLVEQRRLRLIDRVATYLSSFGTNGKDAVTVRDMLRYSSGLPIDNNKLDIDDRDAIWRFMEETPLEYQPGTKVQYSDLAYRLLGHLVEKIAGTDLNTFMRANLWGPLGMDNTTYNPSPLLASRCAATGPGSFGLRVGMLRGSLQDDQDWKLGGIVGCDGVFSTARDIAVFCQMFLNRGRYGPQTILRPQTVAAMVSNQTSQVSDGTTDLDPFSNLLFTDKGYGFELWTPRFSSGGMRLSPGSYGKTGGGGTFLWVDPRRHLVGVLLTNRGLPVPFDKSGWARLIDDVAPAEFFDGIVNALRTPLSLK